MSTKGAGNKISIGIGGSGGTGGAAGNVGPVTNQQTRPDHHRSNHYSPGILAMSVGGGGGTGSTTITTNLANGVDGRDEIDLGRLQPRRQGWRGRHRRHRGRHQRRGHHHLRLQVARHRRAVGGRRRRQRRHEHRRRSVDRRQVHAESRRQDQHDFGRRLRRRRQQRRQRHGQQLRHHRSHGDNAYGIYAQSVGGGGGDGGFTASHLTQRAERTRRRISWRRLLNFGVGGSGGAGGDSGNVVVNHTGSITSTAPTRTASSPSRSAAAADSVGISISSPIWTAADRRSRCGDGRDATVRRPDRHRHGQHDRRHHDERRQQPGAVHAGGERRRRRLDLFLDSSRTAVGLGKGGFVLPNNGGISKGAALIRAGRGGWRPAGSASAVEATSRRRCRMPGGREVGCLDYPEHRRRRRQLRRIVRGRRRLQRSTSRRRSAPSRRTTRAGATSR